MFWQDTFEIEVGRPYSAFFDVTFERIMPLHEAAHPEISASCCTTYERYAHSNTALRETLAGEQPDVTLKGLNRRQVLVDREITNSPGRLTAAEEDFARDGYDEAKLALGTFGADVHGLPFAVSLPVGQYNMALMALIGGTMREKLLTVWTEVIDMCGQLRQGALLHDWIVEPGHNGLVITKVIYDSMEGIVTGDFENVVELQDALTKMSGTRCPSYRGLFGTTSQALLAASAGRALAPPTHQNPP